MREAVSHAILLAALVWCCVMMAWRTFAFSCFCCLVSLSMLAV